LGQKERVKPGMRKIRMGAHVKKPGAKGVWIGAEG